MQKRVTFLLSALVLFLEISLVVFLVVFLLWILSNAQV